MSNFRPQGVNFSCLGVELFPKGDHLVLVLSFTYAAIDVF